MAILYLSRRKTLQMQRNESRAQMRPGKTPRSPSTSSSILSGSILGQGLLYRWTEHSILPICTTGGRILNSNNATQTHSIFVKLSENTFFPFPS